MFKINENVITINGVRFNVTDSIAEEIYNLCIGKVVKNTPVVQEETKSYKCSRNITECGYDFAVTAKNGGVVATSLDGKWIPNTLRKVCNFHLKQAGFRWDGTIKAYVGGDSSKVDTHITQEEYNSYADKVDARNARKFGA